MKRAVPHAWLRLCAFAFITALLLVVLLGSVALATQDADPRFGLTFSSRYARDLGLDWREAYVATLEDLAVQHIRLPIYWDEFEPEQGVFWTEDIDWMLQIASEHDVTVTLVTGMKVPRWPECFLPHWAKALSQELQSSAMLNTVSFTVERYRMHPALERWQVENEPVFLYGECPLPDLDRLKQEIALVRQIDPSHPIVLTSSGEQAAWTELAPITDIIGVSLYRFAWSPVLGPIVFPHPSLYYRIQTGITELVTGKTVLISELQMEPWYEDGREAGDQIIHFSPDDFLEHIAFARKTGVSEIWLWGVEWWYQQKVLGDERYWQAAKALYDE